MYTRKHAQQNKKIRNYAFQVLRSLKAEDFSNRGSLFRSLYKALREEFPDIPPQRLRGRAAVAITEYLYQSRQKGEHHE